MSPDLVAVALAHLERGHSVLSVGPDKRPVPRAWEPYQRERMTTREAIRRFGRPGVTGVGLVCGALSDLDVLDFDGTVGLEAYRALAHLIPEGAGIVETGSGGRHVYCSHREGQRVRPWSWKGAKAGELRGEGGYVLAPPSRHPSGTFYRWLREPVYPLPHVPDALLAALFPPEPERPKPTTRPASRPSGKGGVEGLVAWACQHGPERGRNDVGLWLACRLRDEGLGKDEAAPHVLYYQGAVERAKPEAYTAAEALATLESAFSRPPREECHPKAPERPLPLAVRLRRRFRGMR